jgi:hypothetical protein
MLNKPAVAKTSLRGAGQPGERWAGSRQGPVLPVETAFRGERMQPHAPSDPGSKSTSRCYTQSIS